MRDWKTKRIKTDKIIRKRVKQIKDCNFDNEHVITDLKQPHRMARKSHFDCSTSDCKCCGNQHKHLKKDNELITEEEREAQL